MASGKSFAVAIGFVLVCPALFLAARKIGVPDWLCILMWTVYGACGAILGMLVSNQK